MYDVLRFLICRSFKYGDIQFQNHLFKSQPFLHQMVFAILLKINRPYLCGPISGLCNLFHYLYIISFHQSHTVLLMINVEIGQFVSSNRIIFPKLFCLFHIHFRIIFSMSIKILSGIFIEIELNIQINFFQCFVVLQALFVLTKHRNNPNAYKQAFGICTMEYDSLIKRMNYWYIWQYI